ncbi:hypothetical protein HHK36_013732 [Tetracentron sinense]|uniref:Uncharacterized protein n=1 Tax=Tetracentron sinense TaxID=13715 RepID=A0A834Z2M4_TETSI|nr:hypothetical protein HHK36_013732 [Tetracentron sinense]
MMRDEEDDAIMRLNRNHPSRGARYTVRSPSSNTHTFMISPPPSLSLQPNHTPIKPSPKILSMFLQAVIMVVVLSIFFVFVGIAAIVLIHICVASGAIHRRRRRTLFPDSAGDGVESGLGLSRDDLKKLPCSNYGAANDPRLAGDCVVCLEGFREGERCRVLPQ